LVTENFYRKTAQALSLLILPGMYQSRTTTARLNRISYYYYAQVQYPRCRRVSDVGTELEA